MGQVLWCYISVCVYAHTHAYTHARMHAHTHTPHYWQMRLEVEEVKERQFESTCPGGCNSDEPREMTELHIFGIVL